MAMKFNVQFVCDKCEGVYDWGNHETVSVQTIHPTVPDNWLVTNNGERHLTLCPACARLWSRYIDRFLESEQPPFASS